MGGNVTVFGVNVADGRIKGYPMVDPKSGQGKLFTVRFVRGNTSYGVNNFTDNGDSTISDSATGLMWTKGDHGSVSGNGPRSGVTWEGALALVAEKNSEKYLGYSDWRLPNAKELQSIVDYLRGPDSTGSASIDTIFNITAIKNEKGGTDYPWYWTSTTHARSDGGGTSACYVCFGRGWGYFMNAWTDVHGAGCQRSDQKADDFPNYTYISDGYYFSLAPQGDAVRIFNYVRLVRNMEELSSGTVPSNSATPGQTLETGRWISQPGKHCLSAHVSLFSPQRVRITVCDLKGRVVTAFNGFLPAGQHDLSLAEQGLRCGTYIATLRTNSVAGSRRFCLIK